MSNRNTRSVLRFSLSAANLAPGAEIVARHAGSCASVEVTTDGELWHFEVATDAGESVVEALGRLAQDVSVTPVDRLAALEESGAVELAASINGIFASAGIAVGAMTWRQAVVPAAMGGLKVVPRGAGGRGKGGDVEGCDTDFVHLTDGSGVGEHFDDRRAMELARADARRQVFDALMKHAPDCRRPCTPEYAVWIGEPRKVTTTTAWVPKPAPQPAGGGIKPITPKPFYSDMEDDNSADEDNDNYCDKNLKVVGKPKVPPKASNKKWTTATRYEVDWEISWRCRKAPVAKPGDSQVDGPASSTTVADGSSKKKLCPTYKREGEGRASAPKHGPKSVERRTLCARALERAIQDAHNALILDPRIGLKKCPKRSCSKSKEGVTIGGFVLTRETDKFGDVTETVTVRWTATRVCCESD